MVYLILFLRVLQLRERLQCEVLYIYFSKTAMCFVCVNRFILLQVHDILVKLKRLLLLILLSYIYN